MTSEKRTTIERGAAAVAAGRVQVLDRMDENGLLVESLTLADLMPEEARAALLGDDQATAGRFDIVVRWRPAT